MKTPEERLKLYNKAIKDYIIAIFTRRIWIIIKICEDSLSREFGYDLHPTEKGFCGYFRVDYMETFPELLEVRPKKNWINEDGDVTWFWYKPGQLIPRIVCLIKARHLVKQLI